MTKTGKKLAAVLLSVVMAVTFIPLLGTQTVSAASGDPAMNFGTEVLNQEINTVNTEAVWYADTKWWVIGYDGSGAVSESGAATLLSAGNLDSYAFDNNQPFSHAYSGSCLEGEVNDILNGSFSSEEQGAIKTRTLVHGDYDGMNTDCIAGGEDLTGVALWPLSTKEANAVSADLRVATGVWWLRSPGAWKDCAAMNYYREVSELGGDVWNPAGVRPAFYLNLDSVLFTSAAVGGKSSDTVGADALTAVGTNSDGEWKVTVKDNAHAGFSILKTTPIGSGLSVKYTGAQTGTNEYISAIKTDETGAIKYYGRIAAVSDEAGTITISTADKFGESDHLYIFNEQYNGDNKTDYASELTEVTIPALVKTAIPAGKTLTYNSESQTGVDDGVGYTLSGITTATDAGSYQAIATLDEGRVWSDWTSYPKTISWKINPKDVTPDVTLSATAYTYNGKVRKPTVTVKVDSVEFDSSQYDVSYASGRKNVGTYKVTVRMNGNYSGSKTVSFKINKANNPLNANGKTATVKYTALKKANKTLKRSAVISLTGAKGTVTYTKASGNKKITIARTGGKVTVKKGLKKGTYKVKVKVKAAGNRNYKASSFKIVTFTVKVK